MEATQFTISFPHFLKYVAHIPTYPTDIKHCQPTTQISSNTCLTHAANYFIVLVQPCAHLIVTCQTTPFTNLRLS